MHDVSPAAAPVRKNKHTAPETQKHENAQIHKSAIFLWVCESESGMSQKQEPSTQQSVHAHFDNEVIIPNLRDNKKKD